MQNIINPIYLETAKIDIKKQLKGMKMRSIGPAGMSGRVTSIDVDLSNPSTIFIGTASGGVWKTNNWGNTYKPIFDGQGSYSIGCVTIDPSNPNVVWVGTGENNNTIDASHDIFDENSWQYILYGMGFKTDITARAGALRFYEDAKNEFISIRQQSLNAMNKVPTHRDLIQEVVKNGFRSQPKKRT